MYGVRSDVGGWGVVWSGVWCEECDVGGWDVVRVFEWALGM